MKYVPKIYFLTILLIFSFLFDLNANVSLNEKVNAVLTNNEDFTFDNITVDSLNPIQLIFSKPVVNQSVDDIYFNILKIRNSSSKDIKGSLNFNLPQNFKLIVSSDSLITIPANQEKFIPIRVSIFKGSEGDKNYLIVADFKYDNKVVSQNSYLSIIGTRNWDMNVAQRKQYVNTYNTISDVDINFTNKGNTLELIKVDIDAGGLLDLVNYQRNSVSFYIELKPNSDTLISLPVKYRVETENSDLSNYWRESTVSVRGSNQVNTRTARVFVDKIESEFYNFKDQRATPLNFEFQVYNIISGSPERFNASVFGTVQFKNYRELSYQLTAQNLLFKSFNEQDFRYQNNTYFNVLYTDENKRIEVGSQIGNNTLHQVFGEGIRSEYRITKKDRIDFAIIKNRFIEDYGISAMYYRNLFTFLNVNVGTTYENNKANDYNAYSIHAGTNVSFLRHHSIGVKLTGTKTDFKNLSLSNSSLKDTSNLGLSYRAFYNLRYRKLNVRISNTNTLNNYIRNSNFNRWDINGSYRFSDSFTSNLFYNRTKIISNSYPYRFEGNSNYNINDVGRINFGYSFTRDVYLMFGSVVNSLFQRMYPSGVNYYSNYYNQHISAFFATRIKIIGNQSLTPSVSYGFSSAQYQENNPLNPIDLSKSNNKSFRFGITYYSKMFRVNAFYNNGLSVVSRQQLLYDDAWVNSQTVQVRPQFEKFYYDGKIKLSSFVNYLYSLPSGRESISFNLSLNFFLNDGWTIYAANNIYSTSRNDVDLGRINNRVYNIFVGLRKSFDIPQPRNKYYDYDIIFFHDKNGDNIQNENERGIPNMLVDIKRDNQGDRMSSNFVETQLISDIDGKVTYKNLPEGKYSTTVTSLDNLEDIYVLDGSEIEFEANNNLTKFIPLTETYKVVGKIIIQRDENSQEGKIDISNIRVTAQSDKGESYSALTDNNGGFILSIPKPGKFNVFINNVLGDYFTLEKSEFTIDFNEVKRVNIDFVFHEKKRGINFNNGGSYQFKSTPTRKDDNSDN